MLLWHREKTKNFGSPSFSQLFPARADSVCGTRAATARSSTARSIHDSVPPMGATVTPSLQLSPDWRVIAAHYEEFSDRDASAVCLFYCFFALLWGQQGERQQWKWLTLRDRMSHWHMAGIITKSLRPLGTIQPPHHCDISNTNDCIIRWSEPRNSQVNESINYTLVH